MWRRHRESDRDVGVGLERERRALVVEPRSAQDGTFDCKPSNLATFEADYG